MIQYALFDLDDTLYPREAGVLAAIGRRIELYLTDRLGLPTDEAHRLRVEYRDRYGTTLAGLLRERHDADAADYLAFVHDVPIEELLQPDPELDAALASLPWACHILTNSDTRHAERTLAALGLRRRFGQIYDITRFGYRQKPEPEVYAQVLEWLGAEGPACLFVDDTSRNLLAAKAWGMTTVWVGQGAVLAEGIDYAVPRAADIARVATEVLAKERAARQG